MAKSNLRLVPPPTENRTVKETEPPRRPPNRELREREHLTDGEVERLIEAARDNRHGYRDALMILMAYRHGLRAAEVTDLKWEQVDFDRGELHVNRLKGGMESTHPLTGRELRELRKHKRYSPPSLRFVFVSERGAPLSGGLQPHDQARRGRRRSRDQGARPHAPPCLRLQAGKQRDRYPVALQAYLGHSNIQNTTRYTALASRRFKNFWRN
jgi:integrase